MFIWFNGSMILKLTNRNITLAQKITIIWIRMDQNSEIKLSLITCITILSTNNNTKFKFACYKANMFPEWTNALLYKPNHIQIIFLIYPLLWRHDHLCKKAIFMQSILLDVSCNCLKKIIHLNSSGCFSISLAFDINSKDLTAL